MSRRPDGVHPLGTSRIRLLWLMLALACIPRGCSAEATIHTVFTTECTAYFTWQSMGALHLPAAQRAVNLQALTLPHLLPLLPILVQA
jgi:hypothetical protein